MKEGEDFKRPDIKICPYWRKIVIQEDKILALCGKASPKERRFPDTDLGPRLRRCPYFTASEAYRYPNIILVDRNNLSEAPCVLEDTNGSGLEAINDLEKVWGLWVQDFSEYPEKFNNPLVLKSKLFLEEELEKE